MIHMNGTEIRMSRTGSPVITTTEGRTVELADIVAGDEVFRGLWGWDTVATIGKATKAGKRNVTWTSGQASTLLPRTWQVR